MSKKGAVTLNFVDAEVAEVVRSILGDILKLNFAIDPKVQGKITLQTSRPLPQSSVMPTLEEVLRLNGLVLVRADDVYHVLPAKEATRGKVSPRLNQPNDQAFGAEIFPLEFISADEMAAIVEPFAPAGSILRKDSERRLLIVAGTSRERRTIREIVNIFDVDWLAGMSFKLVILRSSDPATLINDLEKVFGAQAKGPLSGVVRFVPVERLNSILVISSKPEYLKRAQTWIEQFDIGAETDEQRLFVYHVRNGRASEIASVLNSIFSGRPQTAKSDSASLAPGLTARRIGSRPRSTYGIQESSELVRRSSPDQGNPGLRLVDANKKRRAQARPETGVENVDMVTPGDMRIIADNVNNALLVLASPRVYRQVEAAIKKLDIVPLQVLIEATIAEVTLNDDLRYGVQWFFQFGSSDVTLSEGASSAIAPIFPGFSYLFRGTDRQVILSALDSVTDVKVISSPQLMVQDNRTAELQVGDQVPVATQSAVSITDPTAPIVNSIQFRDTGVVLRVTPRVNAGGLVSLDIELEVSDVVTTTTSGIDSPTIQQRRISTSVVVQNGETIALGGLIRDSRTSRKSGVPLLSRIPILGSLFGTTDNTLDRTELLILITPRVVTNFEDARTVTEQLKRRIRSVFSDAKKEEGSDTDQK